MKDYLEGRFDFGFTCDACGCAVQGCIVVSQGKAKAQPACDVVPTATGVMARGFPCSACAATYSVALSISNERSAAFWRLDQP